MKIFKIAAALGLMVTGLGISTGASAQNYERHHSDRGDYHGDRRDDRGDRRNWGGDRHDWRGGHRGYYGNDRGRGYGYGHGWGHNRDCRTTWRHHRRVTVCYR